METENVWDYPRPPRLEKTKNLIVVVFGGILVETRDAFRVLETSHPPTYYLQAQDFRENALTAVSGSTFCEWKGEARYFDIQAPNGKIATRAAWDYPSPSKNFLELQGYVAVYPSKVERCFVDGEEVRAQEGDFYGGWITSRIQGPFKGGPGTFGW